MPQSLRRNVLDSYHFYPNHPDVSRLSKTIREVCYLKGLITQVKLFSKTYKICQQFKRIKTLYRHLPLKNIAELKPWDTVHVDLIGPYSKLMRQHHPDNTGIYNNASLTCMRMIDPTTVWFKIVEMPMFDLSW